MFANHIAEIKGDIMNFTQWVTIIEEAMALLGELKKDGTFDELIKAEQLIQNIVENNAKFKDLVAKLQTIKL